MKHFRDEIPLDKCAKDTFLSKSQAFRRITKSVQVVAEYYEKLAKSEK